MHKDSPPGTFDFARRSLRYTIGLGLLTGFLLSIFVYVAMWVWRADAGIAKAPKASGGVLEATMPARSAPASTAAPNTAVRY